MSQLKICPSCGLENPVNETMCGRCMADISSVEPVNDIDVSESKIINNPQLSSGATVIEKNDSLCFEAVDGSGKFYVESGAVIGREAAGSEYLKKYQTVSRRHAQLKFNNSSWDIEDLNSTNGTWINERKIEANKANPIKSGDIVAFSRSCVFVIKN